VLRDCTAFVPVGVVDLLRKAQVLAQACNLASSRPLLDVALVSPGKSPLVRAAGGLKICCAATLQQVRGSNLVVVPPVDPDIVDHLARNKEVVPWLRQMYERGADLASACTGSFLLGEAELLDGRAATTHWAFQGLLRSRYPKVAIEPEAIVVDQGRICTAG